MTVETIIGYAAALLTTLSFLPQVIRTWKTRSTRDISLAMFAAFCAGVFLWMVYGILIGSWPVIIANATVFVLAGIILVLKLKHG
jgi:MtN3 and saliva related transmembrane protein